MYSQKDGISIPKNYNGVRFRSSPDPMPMKEHRPVYRQEVKTAHSPLYNTDKSEAEATVFTESEELSEDIYIENDTAAQDYYETEAASATEIEED